VGGARGGAARGRQWARMEGDTVSGQAARANAPAERVTSALPTPTADPCTRPHRKAPACRLFHARGATRQTRTPANMITITLPDGSRREFDAPVTVMQVAESIGPGLAKATVAGKVDGRQVDASDLIDRDASLQILTPKD